MAQIYGNNTKGTFSLLSLELSGTLANTWMAGNVGGGYSVNRLARTNSCFTGEPVKSV